MFSLAPALLLVTTTFADACGVPVLGVSHPQLLIDTETQDYGFMGGPGPAQSG